MRVYRVGVVRSIRCRLYQMWVGMRRRCTNPAHQAYPYYGGRGICVCEDWSSFQPFYQWAMDAGFAIGLQIDRRNNDGNYEPWNCRFVTPTENARNRKSVKLNPETAAAIRVALTRGERITDLAKQYGVNRGTIYRIKTGENWSQP